MAVSISEERGIAQKYISGFPWFMVVWGLGGFLLCVVALSMLMGPFGLVSIVVAFTIFFQINQINHTFVDLPYFPFKSLSWITAKHHVHHENMHKGNYATITLFYDKIFGTLD